MIKSITFQFMSILFTWMTSWSYNLDRDKQMVVQEIRKTANPKEGLDTVQVKIPERLILCTGNRARLLQGLSAVPPLEKTD